MAIERLAWLSVDHCGGVKLSIDSNDLYLRGRCQISVDGKAKSADCYLNLKDQTLDCSFQSPPELVDFSAMMSDQYNVTDLEISSPVGKLTCERVPVAFASSVGGGGWSVAQTALSQTIAIDARPTKISFVLNEALELKGAFDDHERLFHPGFDTVGNVHLGEDLFFNGSKDRISLAGAIESDSADLRVVLGLCVGVPVREFARQEPGKISIWLNNYHQQTTQPRPFIFTGEVFRDVDTTRKNLVGAYDAASSYLRNLPPKSKPGARNAILTLLDGRALVSSYELKLLAAFHFLEWFDGSKTLSATQLTQRLQISRKEADAIVASRNGLVHNEQDVASVIETAWKATGESAVELIKDRRAADLDAGYGYLNYLYSLLGAALMREIGYNGRTQPYLPW